MYGTIPPVFQGENHVMFNWAKTLEIIENFNAAVCCWKDLFETLEQSAH